MRVSQVCGALEREKMAREHLRSLLKVEDLPAVKKLWETVDKVPSTEDTFLGMDLGECLDIVPLRFPLARCPPHCP